ncbi:hypothetical protein ACLOJK_015657 [Asimina triloba]
MDFKFLPKANLLCGPRSSARGLTYVGCTVALQEYGTAGENTGRFNDGLWFVKSKIEWFSSVFQFDAREGEDDDVSSNPSPVIMSGRESVSAAASLQQNSVPSPPLMQGMKLGMTSDGTAVYKPPGNSPIFPGGGGGEAPVAPVGSAAPIAHYQPMRRKRGRPRKYGADGTVALALTPINSIPLPSPSTPPSGGNSGGFSFPPPPSFMMKKARGRPPGSSKKQQMVALAQFILRKWLAGSAGVGFTPHIITVKAGEKSPAILFTMDAGKPTLAPTKVCILSANGSISNVTLRQAATSGGTVTYEGRFEILSLSGSFLLTETGGQRSRTGGLSVLLAGPDGRVLGGGVAGILTAASPVQVILGSFLADIGSKESKPMNSIETSTLPPKMNNPAAAAAAAGTSSPPSRGTMSESSGGPGSPPNQSPGAWNNSAQHGIPQNICNVSAEKQTGWRLAIISMCSDQTSDALAEIFGEDEGSQE